MRWITALFAGWLCLIGPGRLDGMLFPVSSPAEMVSVRVDPKDSDWVIISGTATKLRDNCSARRLDWNLGDRGQSGPSVAWSWGPPIARGPGEFDFDGWRVQAAPEEVLSERTYADVIHRCRFLGIGLPWETRTRFWR